MTAIKKFPVKSKYLQSLSANEKELLPILEEAVKKIDKIYLLQENGSDLGANFYPADATKKEIEDAAQNYPNIFSPFTIVERKNSGKLISVDYHIKYAKLIEPVSKLLARAGHIAQNPSFKKYLQTLSESLKNGDYRQADIAWLKIKNTSLDVTIGPYERNLDKLFFIKRAYQGHLGILDIEKTKRAKLIRDTLYTNIGQKPHRIQPPSIVDIAVEQVLLFSGFLGRLLFAEQHLPSDSDVTEKYGSKILGYASSMDYKFEKLLKPIFNAVFEKKFRERYSHEMLRVAHYYYVLITALARQLHRYQGSRERLKELFPIYDEANCVVSGVQHSKQLILKGVIDQKELEAIMVIQICRIFSEWIIYKKTNSREGYLKGDTLTFNFLLKEGALQQKDGISWPNFAKMFFETENLSAIFVRFLSEGTYQEAGDFLAKYLSFEPFQAFDKRLGKIKPIN